MVFGFVWIAESTESVRTQLSIDGEWMISSVNDARYRCGTLTFQPKDRERANGSTPEFSSGKDRTTLREIVANVQTLHQDPNNRNAIFQVASQCNLLEMYKTVGYT